MLKFKAKLLTGFYYSLIEERLAVVAAPGGRRAQEALAVSAAVAGRVMLDGIFQVGTGG